MSTALDFTRDINDLPPMNQRPLKAKNGMLVTPQRVKSDKMLSEAPPEDISTESKFIEYKGPTKISDTPNVFYPQQEMEMGQRPFDEAMQRYMMTYGSPGSTQNFEQKLSMGKIMTPSQLEMIMDAQKNKDGVIQLLEAKNEPESGLARLIENLPKEYII